MSEISALNVVVVDKIGREHVYGQAGSGLRRTAKSYSYQTHESGVTLWIYDAPNSQGNVIAFFHDPARVELVG